MEHKIIGLEFMLAIDSMVKYINRLTDFDQCGELFIGTVMKL